MIVLASILLPLHIIIKEGQNQMTEWEKLQQGVIYNDFDEDLFERRVAAKKLFKAYNKADDEEVELRNQIMQR